MALNMSKRAQTMNEWKEIFPIDILEDPDCSLNFIKQLTTVIMSSVLRRKINSPPENYKIYYLKGLRLSKFQGNNNSPVENHIYSGIKNAAEAYDNRLVDDLVICFYEGGLNPENIVQYFAMEYTFKSYEDTMDEDVRSYNIDGLMERTVTLLTDCMMYAGAWKMNSLSLANLLLRLSHVPPYPINLPGYYPDYGNHFEEAYMKQMVYLGSVETPYHIISVSCYYKQTM